jgi:hypothetical protein
MTAIVPPPDCRPVGLSPLGDRVVLTQLGCRTQGHAELSCAFENGGVFPRTTPWSIRHDQCDCGRLLAGDARAAAVAQHRRHIWSGCEDVTQAWLAPKARRRGGDGQARPGDEHRIYTPPRSFAAARLGTAGRSQSPCCTAPATPDTTREPSPQVSRRHTGTR